MATNPFPGLRSSGDYSVTGQRPENFREKILELFPNGDTPLTALLSMVSSEKTDDSVFHWYQRTLSNKRATGTAGAFVYEDSGFTNAYDANDDYAAGLSVYVKVTAAQCKEFRPGHQVLLRDADDFTNDVNGVVTETAINGATSRLTVKLLQADGTGNGDLSNCDTVLIIGNANAEGADVPDSVMYDPEEKNNQAQIFRTPLELTRTALQTRLRTGDPYKDAKTVAAREHAREQEYAYIFGHMYSDTGANGKPRRFTRGIINSIRADAPANVVDYVTAPTPYDGKTWLQKGEDWINEQLEIVFRYGSDGEKIGLCGSGALLGIQKLASLGSFVALQPGATEYGLQVMKWLTPFGVLNLKVHPLFSHEPTNRNSILILEPRNLKYRYVQDTIFKKDTKWREGGFTSLDGLKEEFLTECGLEIHFPETMMYLNGVGQDNP